MQKRIFISILGVALLMLVTSIAIILSSIYRHFTEEQFEQLRNEIKLATRGVELNGADYLTRLDAKDFRVTWITGDGTILFDNEADLSAMENHLAREEIRNALETGYGESTRYSETLLEKQLYTAQKLSDGSVLRLSITHATIWRLFLHFLIPVLITAGAAVLLSTVIASRVSRRIVDPINSIDLDHPLLNANDKMYTEIRPLLNRLDAQHRQIEADKEELQKTSLIRQEFTANASHELKTPLHVISGYAELLESGMANREDAKKFAGMIRAESQRMSTLVGDILDLSSLDSGGVGMKREQTDLYRIAKNAVDSLEQTAEESDIKINLEGDHADIFGIPHVLYSLVYNLCNNAVKYSYRGQEVFVRIRKEPDKIVLSVKDSGIGISAEDQERIFERFYRVDKSRSKEVGGTGLGLSIVKHAALTHNAAIRVESALGKGSEFTVTFPV